MARGGGPQGVAPAAGRGRSRRRGTSAPRGRVGPRRTAAGAPTVPRAPRRRRAALRTSVGLILIDKSAWARADPEDIERHGEPCLCAITRLEILFSATSAADYDQQQAARGLLSDQ